MTAEARAAAGDQRVALVTGGTDGIGRAVATALARAGDQVVISGRDPKKGREVLAELRCLNPSAHHRFLVADLSLLAATSQLADEVLACAPRLDALVCCAGVLSTVPAWTSEGLEQTFVLNYLSRFLLAQRLSPALTQSPSGRLVLVANAGRYRDTLDFDDLQLHRGLRGLEVSGRSQFANDLLAIELADQLQQTSVEVTCVYPGVVKTQLFRHAVGLPRLARMIAPVLVAAFGRDPHVAAQTPVWLARDPAAVGVSGGFFGPQIKPIHVPPRAQNLQRRQALWSASLRLVADQGLAAKERPLTSPDEASKPR